MLTAGLSFGLWCCWFIATRTDVAQIVADLRGLSWTWIALGASSVFAAMVCRTAKWRLMLAAADGGPRPGWFSSFTAVMVTRARVGEELVLDWTLVHMRLRRIPEPPG